jgi:hypothetical protein
LRSCLRSRRLPWRCSSSVLVCESVRYGNPEAPPELLLVCGGLTVAVVTRAQGAASRTAAVRAAQQAAAARLAALHQHEESLEQLLADFYQARAQSQEIRADAEVRASRLRETAEAKAARLRHDAETAVAELTKNAEQDAASYDEQATDAVRAMLQLGETRTAIAEITGLSTAAIRAAQHA